MLGRSLQISIVIITAIYIRRWCLLQIAQPCIASRAHFDNTSVLHMQASVNIISLCGIIALKL